MTALPVQAAQVSVDVAEDLEVAVRFARSEDQLEAALERIQTGFKSGHLTQAQADQLTYLVIDVARQLARGVVNVPVGTP